MTDWLTQGLAVSGNLTVLEIAVSIILLSYLLEDLAIITAALLAADQSISPEIALIAIFIGIATGDIALYGAGALAAKWRGLRYRLLKNRGMRIVRSRLKHRPLLNIAIIRFIPGLRTIGFTLSGLFGIKFHHFMGAVMLATAIWTAFIFFCIYQLGSISWLSDSQWKWIIAPCAFVVLWLINRTSRKKMNTHGKGASI
ncbi:VTT domain-containing protein [Vibrio sp. VB16]|uniref:VTT domain-containing protein n=1 Tax=Vibrio sp. VB16 TaxID=2785746 RepID=UPI00189D9E8D|nr:VTT domain-containing protein [Vibrio sp. VB16]UGA56817.1 VTT domain-containing protein [Vibrio sp. VB16]